MVPVSPGVAGADQGGKEKTKEGRAGGPAGNFNISAVNPLACSAVLAGHVCDGGRRGNMLVSPSRYLQADVIEGGKLAITGRSSFRLGPIPRRPSPSPLQHGPPVAALGADGLRAPTERAANRN